MASWTYAYDASNKLTEVKAYGTTGALAETIDYKYDAFGEEIEEDVTSALSVTTATKFVYDGWNPNMPAGTGNANFVQWAMLNGDNSLQSRNIDGNMPGQHLARVDQSGASDASGVYYDFSDRLNSVRVVTDASGAVKDAITYDPYGNFTETDSNYGGWYKWTGQETDQQTLLQYNNARWYNPATGTWMTQDPLGFDAGDSNLYRYVNNRPTIATDPSGYHPDDWGFWDCAGLIPIVGGIPSAYRLGYYTGRNQVLVEQGARLDAKIAANNAKFAAEIKAAKDAEPFDFIIGQAGIKDGQTPETKLGKLMDYFSTLEVKVGPGAKGAPTYWANKDPKKNSQTVEGLIATGNGMCGPWAQLFLKAAKRAEINKGGEIQMAVVQIANSLGGANNMIVDEKTPAQNNKRPARWVWNDHIIVLIKVDNTVFFYDPSYGKISEKVTGKNIPSIEKLVNVGELNPKIPSDPSVKKALQSYSETSFTNSPALWMRLFPGESNILK